MSWRTKVLIAVLFITSVFISVFYGPPYFTIEYTTYFKALSLYFLFTALYSHLKIIVKKGNANIDYGISYSLSMALFSGPLGLLLFEVINRFTAYFYRKATHTADRDEFLHTFYNIGSHTLNYTIAFFVFTLCNPFMQHIPFGFWILMITLVVLVSVLSDFYLIMIFTWEGEFKTKEDITHFIKSRSKLDMGKTVVTNGLLFWFLQNGQWEILVGMFVLNYLVSRSAYEKSESIQHKIERDKFKQMAYTDFLTEVYNRAYMNLKIDELDEAGETVGVIVADIDSFKNINDTYNHTVGDRVIQHCAAMMQSQLGPDDFLFHSGGEEFTMFLRNKTYPECLTVAKRMNQIISETPAQADFKGATIHIAYTSSFGLYFFRPTAEVGIKKAYVHADTLLFTSKSQGKNCVSAQNGLEKHELALTHA